ncbi:MAG: toll/interleukin-1 receptor domain-containing protein [Bacteroidota bacterium]
MPNSELPRQKIFISHANPEDNRFATWLYFKLLGIGYDVWCEIKTLRPGEYFWDKIEGLIRNETVKFLFVASADSAIKRGGMSDEFEFARSIEREKGFERFIYVLKVDDTPSNARIGQHRINHIDFSQSWLTGLNILLKELKDDLIHQNTSDFSLVKNQWKNLVEDHELIIDQEETYTSNKFPIELPKFLYCHAFKGFIKKEIKPWEYPFSVHFYNNYTLSFANVHDFENEFSRLIAYDHSATIEIPISEILDGSYDTNFMTNRDALNAVKFLLGKAISSHFKQSGLRRYSMSSRRESFWYPLDVLQKNKAGGVQMVGKLKAVNWHFAISAAPILTPIPVYSFSSHIIFTEDGYKVLSTDSAQHKARRKQGRLWWNKQWREKLFGFIAPMVNEKGVIEIRVGSQSRVLVSAESILFVSPVSYADPDNFIGDEDELVSNDAEGKYLNTLEDDYADEDDD